MDSAGDEAIDEKHQQPYEPKLPGKESASFVEERNSAERTAEMPERKRGTNDAKKTVTFADHVQERMVTFADPKAPNAGRQTQPSTSLLRGSFDTGDRVIELDDDDDMLGSTPIIPDDESPEDARLRREMLQYSLNEVGSVVAELDLDETYSDDDDDDYDFDEDDEDTYESDVTEEEDEFGRSIRKGVSKSYRQQMLDLEQKLSARMIENLGPSPDEDTAEIDPDDLRKLVVRKEEDERPAAVVAKETTKKGVRFADKLDVSTAPVKEESASRAAHKTSSAPISDVIERPAPKAEETIPVNTGRSARPSRFKQSRNTTGPAEPSRPTTHIEPHIQTQPEDFTIEEPREGPVLSKEIVERPSTSGNAPAPEDDDFDPELQQRQLASEYYRIRNSMIQQQGGFRAIADELDQPLMEDRDGKVKKVSRFKAARMNF